jgi:hypothetical protein
MYRAAVRQPDKPNIASFFRDVMDEYEMIMVLPAVSKIQTQNYVH